MQAEILLTLKLQQKLFADPRRISLLKHIALSGSISQGAKDAGISYKRRHVACRHGGSRAAAGTR